MHRKQRYCTFSESGAARGGPAANQRADEADTAGEYCRFEAAILLLLDKCVYLYTFACIIINNNIIKDDDNNNLLLFF